MTRMSEPGDSGTRQRAAARRAAGIYVIAASAWIFASDLAMAPLVEGTELVAAASMIKGAAFVLVTGVLLYSLLAGASIAPSVATASSSDSNFEPAWRKHWNLWLVALAAAMIAASVWTFRGETDKFAGVATHQLETRAEIKSREIGAWLDLRAASARSYSRARFLQDDLPDLLNGDAGARARVEQRLGEIQREFGAESFAILDPFGRVLAQAGEFPAPSDELRRDILEVSKSHAARLRHLHRASPRPDAPAVIDHVVPVELPATTGAALAVLVLRDAAARTLLPMLEHWPVASHTGEAYLARRNDDRVEFLSAQPQRAGASLSSGTAVTDPLRIGALLVRGAQVAEGIDYRGKEVLAASRIVPGTDWRVIAKIDRTEAIEPARTRAWLNIAVMLALFFLSAFGASALWRQRLQLAALRERALLTERDALGEHLNLLSRHANDVVLLLDDTGRIRQANERALEAYGRTRAELIGAQGSILRPPALASSFADNMGHVLHKGSAIYEAVHQRANGVEFPVEISARRIDSEGGTFVQAIIRDISERKRAAEELRESDRRFKDLLRNIHLISLMLDGDGRITYCNDHLLHLTGWAHDEVVGASWFEKFLPPEIVPELKGVFASLLADLPDAWNYENEILTRSGERRLIRWNNTVLRSAAGEAIGTASIGEDITERKRAQAAIEDSEERFRAMIEQSISGTCIIDAVGRFAYVNPRLAAILGYESSEPLVGRPVLEVVAPESHEIIRENMRERMAGVPQRERYHFVALRADGTRVTLGAHGNAGRYRGEPVLITTVQDVTELRRAEEEVGRTIAKLQAALHSTIAVVSTIGELRDPYTHGHEHRVGEIAAAIAAEMALSEDRVEGVRVCGYLHDVGKIAVPAEILAKPSRLSAAEFALVKQHAQQSYEILKGIEFPWPVAEAAWSHHERLDGSGYPRGLKGEEIVLEARILAVADTVEAMASHRPYRPGLGIDKALDEIVRGRSKSYDPDAVDACVRLFREKGYSLPQ